MSEASTPPGGGDEAPGVPAESGSPVARDAIDPDLVRLRRPRLQIGVVTALGIVILCLYIGFRLDGDRRFGSEPEAPREVTLDAASRGEPDTHVRITARIERAWALRAQPSPGHSGLRIVPVLGTSDRLWLALPGDGWSPPGVDGRYTGRLYRFDSMHFADPVRDRLTRPQPNFVRGPELQRARLASASSGVVQAVTGAEITVSADTPIEIEVADPQAATVVATFNDRFRDAAAWTAALSQAAVIAPGVVPSGETPGYAAYDIRGPNAVEATVRKVEAAGLGGARVDPVTVRHLAPWRDLTPSDSGLTFPGGATLPWAAIDVAAVWTPRVPPANARILVVGEAPAQYWYVLPICVVLGVFGLLFAWALVRAVRRDVFGAS